MLFYERSESRVGSRLPQEAIDYGYLWRGVEAETGADFVITPDLSDTHRAILMQSQGKTYVEIARRLDMQIADVADAVHASEDLSKVLYEYLYRGSLAVQRKSGEDVVRSVQDHGLERAIARMYKSVPYGSQRVLLYTGIFTQHNGNVVVDGRETGLSYMAFVMALTSWANRGGVVVHLDGDEFILPWVKLVEKKLNEYQHEDTKGIYSDVYFPPDMPDEDSVLQIPVEVTDWRVTLATIPGIGPDKINAICAHLEEVCQSEPTLTVALQYAMSKDAADSINGWGPKSTASVRRWMGLKDNESLMILVDEEE
jgi:hypothetical protein